MATLTYSKAIEEVARYDVIVAGSGPAGICAAVSAARMGAKTAILERYGVLGGNLTVGAVGPIMGSVAKGTMRDELTTLLSVGYNDIQGKVGRVHDMELTKRVIADFLNREGVDVYLQTPVVDVIKAGNCVEGVVVSLKEGGLAAMLAKVLIDATGDGDAASLAGAPYEVGREGDGLLQPVTLMYVLDNVGDDALVCIGEEDNVQLRGERFLDFTARCAAEGILPANTSSVRLYRTVNSGERLVNTTQMNYINPLNPAEVFKAELELRNQIDRVTDFLRKFVPGYENCRIRLTADTLGVRESRRIKGDYTLTVDDLRVGRRFEDAVVHNANFVVDIHNPDGGGQAHGLAEVVKPYDIPYRCLLPVGVENLLLAGRCISGTHEAHASYRIMTVCMAVGEAAGIAAALSASKNVPPRQLPAADVQNALIAKGTCLFDIS